jgi:hypothetical protein
MLFVDTSASAGEILARRLLEYRLHCTPFNAAWYFPFEESWRTGAPFFLSLEKCGWARELRCRRGEVEMNHAKEVFVG